MPHAHFCSRHGHLGGQPCPGCARERDQRHNQARRSSPAGRAAIRARAAVTPAQRARVYRRDNHRCIDCGSTVDLTVDHIVPVVTTRRVRYRDNELATRCRSCNSRRGARHAAARPGVTP